MPSSIVRSKNNVGVLKLPPFLKCVYSRAHIHVHLFDHCGIDNITIDALFLDIDLLNISAFCNPAFFVAFKRLLRRHVRNVRGIV